MIHSWGLCPRKDEVDDVIDRRVLGLSSALTNVIEGFRVGHHYAHSIVSVPPMALAQTTRAAVINIGDPRDRLTDSSVEEPAQCSQAGRRNHNHPSDSVDQDVFANWHISEVSNPAMAPRPERASGLRTLHIAPFFGRKTRYAHQNYGLRSMEKPVGPI